MIITIIISEERKKERTFLHECIRDKSFCIYAYGTIADYRDPTCVSAKAGKSSPVRNITETAESQNCSKGWDKNVLKGLNSF